LFYVTKMYLFIQITVLFSKACNELAGLISTAYCQNNNVTL